MPCSPCRVLLPDRQDHRRRRRRLHQHLPLRDRRRQARPAGKEGAVSNCARPLHHRQGDRQPRARPHPQARRQLHRAPGLPRRLQRRRRRHLSVDYGRKPSTMPQVQARLLHIYPPPQVSTAVVEPNNSVLSTHSLLTGLQGFLVVFNAVGGGTSPSTTAASHRLHPKSKLGFTASTRPRPSSRGLHRFTLPARTTV